MKNMIFLVFLILISTHAESAQKNCSDLYEKSAISDCVLSKYNLRISTSEEDDLNDRQILDSMKKIARAYENHSDLLKKRIRVVQVSSGYFDAVDPVRPDPMIPWNGSEDEIYQFLMRQKINLDLVSRRDRVEKKVTSLEKEVMGAIRKTQESLKTEEPSKIQEVRCLREEIQTLEICEQILTNFKRLIKREHLGKHFVLDAHEILIGRKAQIRTDSNGKKTYILSPQQVTLIDLRQWLKTNLPLREKTEAQPAGSSTSVPYPNHDNNLPQRPTTSAR